MYSVEMTPSENEAAILVSEHETEAAAIEAARELAATVDQAVTWIVVNDPNGDEIWNNEGDWRNAVR